MVSDVIGMFPFILGAEAKSRQELWVLTSPRDGLPTTLRLAPGDEGYDALAEPFAKDEGLEALIYVYEDKTVSVTATWRV